MIRDKAPAPTTRASWSGELRWPCELAFPPGADDAVDCRELVSLGTWAHALLHARQGLRLAGCNDLVRKQLESCGVPVRFVHASQVIAVGVGSDERRMLFAEDPAEPSGPIAG